MDNEYLHSLEERISLLEKMLNNVVFGEGKDITFTNCQIETVGTGPDCTNNFVGSAIGHINTGSECQIDIESSSIGSVIDSDIEDAEDRLDDLECSLDDLTSQIDDVEQNLD